MKRLENSKLFKRLLELEKQKYGNSNPLSTNIKIYLIPVAKDHLSRIPVYMQQYTLHNIEHCYSILENIDRIIPNIDELNMVEIYILIISVILHDIGMNVEGDDVEKIKESNDFKKMLLQYDRNTDEKEILTEYIRKTHVKRSADYVDKFKNNSDIYKINFEYESKDLTDWIKNVIISHGLSVRELYNEDKYPLDRIIADTRVNISYLALLLRLGDVLDFDTTRTPYYLYRHINPSDSVSNFEWLKQLSIEGKDVNKEKISFDAKCNSAKVERGIREYVAWIEEEIKESLLLLENKNKKELLELEKEVTLKIRNDGSYVYSDLKIEFEYKKVLGLLMGTELYDSPDVFIRELLQNSYDACFCREEVMKRHGEVYKPQIKINYDTITKVLVVEDNGIGISQDVFEEYILKIGNSYYNSKSFQTERLSFKPISNFGIGMLSCFMVSDFIKIESRRYMGVGKNEDAIDYTLQFNDRYVEMRSSNYNRYGTKITLKLRDEYSKKLQEKGIQEIVEENMICQKIPIDIEVDEQCKRIEDEKIKIPEEYFRLNNVEVVDIKNLDWLEGYMLIHSWGHQGLVNKNKIAQQGFTVMTNNLGNFNLNIGWLNFVRYSINILPPNTLNLKASRNSIKDDNKLDFLKETISKLLLNYFSMGKNKNKFYHYCSSGRGNILSGTQKELKFLLDVVKFNSIDKTNKTDWGAKSISAQSLLNKCNKKKKIVVINQKIIEKYWSDKDLKEELFSYDEILLSNDYIHQFYQLFQPYTLKNEIIISSISGVTYHELEILLDKSNEIEDYDLKYS